MFTHDWGFGTWGNKMVYREICHCGIFPYERGSRKQNVKKWEKRILDGYDAVRTFIHEHVIPVGERISIVLSRLRGISIWYSRSVLSDMIGVINLNNYHSMIQQFLKP